VASVVAPNFFYSNGLAAAVVPVGLLSRLDSPPDAMHIIVPGNDVCELALEEKKYLTTFSGGAEHSAFSYRRLSDLEERSRANREETRERHALLSAEEWHYYLYLTR
jgi:hypothetical protein